MAAVDLFLKIDGIAGESTDRAHAGEIEAVAFSWGEHAQVASPGGGGAGTGKVVIGDLQVIMRTSIASPLLMLSCASGKHHATARLAARRRGGDRRSRDFLVISLRDVTVTSYRVGANESGDDVEPTDQVSLAFRQIEFEVTATDPRGGSGQSVKTGWDLDRNAPVAPSGRRGRRRAE